MQPEQAADDDEDPRDDHAEDESVAWGVASKAEHRWPASLALAVAIALQLVLPDTVIHGLTEVILATVASGDPVAISGFAKFSKSARAARLGRNPQTGETIQIAAKTTAKITPLKGFKDVVLGVTPAPKL